MTYPPQPGQPDGQQPPQGAYPQGNQNQGGFGPPQQGGHYGQGGFPPPGQGGYPYGPGGYGPPPRGSKTGLWIGVAVGVVVLIVLAITGFVAPGFFLSDDSKSAAGTPDATAQAIVDNINKKDQAALTALKCPDATPDIDTLIKQIDNVKTAKLSGPPQKVSETEYTAAVAVTLKSNKQGTYSGELSQENGKWCWKGTSAGGSSSSSPSTSRSSSSTGSSAGGADLSSAQAVAQQWADALNAGSSGSLRRLVCRDDPNINAATYGQTVALAAVQNGAKFAVGQSDPKANDPATTSFNLDGTGGGQPVIGILDVTNKGGSFCVSGFIAGQS